MLRTTLYGTLTHDEELNKNEKAMLYIKECAELVGLEVIEGETAFSITFMAEIMKRLRETIDSEHQWIPVSERLPEADEYIGNVARYYLVQNEYGDMLVARYTHSEYWEQIYQLKPISDEIVAWMPLPEPYKGGEKNETDN